MVSPQNLKAFPSIPWGRVDQMPNGHQSEGVGINNKQFIIAGGRERYQKERVCHAFRDYRLPTDTGFVVETNRGRL